MLDYTMKRLDGSEQNLTDYQGKVLMLVNVASYCGNTPQYADLQSLYRRYQPRGFEVLGFPANNFGRQEPGTDAPTGEPVTLVLTAADPPTDQLLGNIADAGPGLPGRGVNARRCPPPQ